MKILYFLILIFQLTFTFPSYSIDRCHCPYVGCTDCGSIAVTRTPPFDKKVDCTVYYNKCSMGGRLTYCRSFAQDASNLDLGTLLFNACDTATTNARNDCEYQYLHTTATGCKGNINPKKPCEISSTDNPKSVTSSCRLVERTFLGLSIGGYACECTGVANIQCCNGSKYGGKSSNTSDSRNSHTENSTQPIAPKPNREICQDKAKFKEYVSTNFSWQPVEGNVARKTVNIDNEKGLEELKKKLCSDIASPSGY